MPALGSALDERDSYTSYGRAELLAPVVIPSGRTSPFTFESRSILEKIDALKKEGDPFSDPSDQGTVARIDLEPEDRISQRISQLLATTSKEPRAAAHFQPLQEWEGYVIDILDEKFVGRLIDITSGSRIEEESAEFLIEDLSDESLQQLKEGAIFRWIIGYLRDANGTKRRVSEIYFRHLPAWSRADIATSNKQAELLSREIDWE